MVKDNLNSLIMESMKAGDKVRTNALRAIKTAIMQWETAEENIGKTLTESIETSIMSKLKNQYVDAAEQCNDGKHEELVIENTALANVLDEFLPKQATEDEIQAIVDALIKGTDGKTAIEPIRKNTGLFINTIKNELPGTDAKLISKVVTKNMK